MTQETKRWLISAVLAGILTAGIGATSSRAQNPNEPPPGSRADKREDRREVRQLQIQVREDEQRLDADTRQFGRRSPQVREDRVRLREDRRRLKEVQRDRRRDRTV